jgi:peptidoglycan hydrolase-like protein with peptidoglycan-binding domain
VKYVTLAQAVATFQQQSGLVVDGQPGRSTQKALWLKNSISTWISESRERLNGKVWWKEARRLLGIGSKFLLYSSGRGYKESWANRSRRNRTSLEWLRMSTIKGALILRKYVKGRMVITWGTEVGHARGRLSHQNGYKIDIDSPGPILKYLAKLRGRRTFPMNAKMTRTIEGQKMTFYRHEPDHVDITFHW